MVGTRVGRANVVRDDDYGYFAERLWAVSGDVGVRSLRIRRFLLPKPGLRNFHWGLIRERTTCEGIHELCVNKFVMEKTKDALSSVVRGT